MGDHNPQPEAKTGLPYFGFESLPLNKTFMKLVCEHMATN